jgi:predicted nicotinamide N-methyase
VRAPALDPARFIADNTRVQSAPLTPELSFHLADETIAIWEKTEEALGRMGLPPPFWAFAWAGGQALARYCLDNPALVSGKRVLDFACGCAVAGIGAARDVVLAGDVFYEGPGAARIAAWLSDLHARGALVLIGDPGRTFMPKDRLEALARYDTPVTRDLEDRDVRLARVWRFKG